MREPLLMTLSTFSLNMLGELKEVNLEVFLTCTLKSLSTKLKKKYNPNILRTEKSLSMLCLIEQYGPSSENDNLS